MKRLIPFLLVIAFCLGLCACGSDSASGTRLNVMSFNVYSSNKESENNSSGTPIDMRVSRRAPSLNDILLGEQIDIAGLQEANAGWQNWLKVGLDKSYDYLGTHTAKTGEGGYIVYRKDKLTPIKNGVFWLADGAPSSSEVGWDGKYDRICTWGLFQVKETEEYLLFMDTHLDHQGALARTYGAALIIEQMDLLRAKFEKDYGVEDCPVVLVGDMNATPGSAPYKKLTSSLLDSFSVAASNPFEEDISTAPGLYYRASEDAYVTNGHRIDHVFLSQENVSAITFNMLHTSSNLCDYGEYLSDHNAVVVQIAITN